VSESVPQKTPSTAAKSQRSATTDRTPTRGGTIISEEMSTPTQFKSATDEEGNRMSILPGSARPKSQPKTQLEILEQETKERKPAKVTERNNFVKIN